MSAAWSCSGLRYTYPTGVAALDDVTLEVPAGRCTALLGPNGSGKSTLLRILLGVVQPSGGAVSYGGRPLDTWSRPALAREIGVVPQGEEAVFPVSVRELVAMGRYPHLGPWRAEGAEDVAAIDEAMRRCDVERFRGRRLDTLSGGERQRVRLARALAQQPASFALDEPTAALDLAHEMAIFERVRELREAGRTVVLATHNLNLAARYADRLVLLRTGTVAAQGPPAEVLTEAIVSDVYGWPVRVVTYQEAGVGGGAPQVVPLGAEYGPGGERGQRRPGMTTRGRVPEDGPDIGAGR